MVIIIIIIIIIIMIMFDSLKVTARVVGQHLKHQ